jgi:hypothetical protein
LLLSPFKNLTAAEPGIVGYRVDAQALNGPARCLFCCRHRLTKFLGRGD